MDFGLLVDQLDGVIFIANDNGVFSANNNGGRHPFGDREMPPLPQHNLSRLNPVVSGHGCAIKCCRKYGLLLGAYAVS